MYEPLSAALSPLDLVAVQMEKKWGPGVLPSLVSQETREKFERSQERLDKAIEGGDFDTVKARAEAHIRGWQALEKEALERGHQHDMVPGIFLAKCDEGVTYAFCEDRFTAQRFTAQNPQMACSTLTFAEVASILQSYSVAYITRAKDPVGYFSGPKRLAGSLGEILDDEIPF